MNKILITGGAGFIGSNLALKLLSKGYNVTIVDNLLPQIHGDNPEVSSPLYISIKDKVKFIFGDVTNRDVLTNALIDQNIVVHLAAETGTGQSMYRIDQYTNTNIQGTSILLDILTNNNNKVHKVIIASSRALYGEGKYLSNEHGIVYPTNRKDRDMKNGYFEVTFPNSSALTVMATDEESKIHPSSVYGITKQVQEQLIMTVCPTINIAPVSLRYQNVYGAGQSLSNPYTGILSIFSTRIRNKLPINIFEDGLESRDFVYIDDVVNATVLCIENEKANNQIFNVGTGLPITVNEVVKNLVNEFSIEATTTISGNYRLGDIRHNYADISKITNLLGFKPTIDFKSGCQLFVNWVNQQAEIKDKYDESILEMKQKGLFK